VFSRSLDWVVTLRPASEFHLRYVHVAGEKKTLAKVSGDTQKNAQGDVASMTNFCQTRFGLPVMITQVTGWLLQTF
jgi:hypothetical protein